MTKCKTFLSGREMDREINTWLELLGPNWKVTHVVLNEYRALVFVVEMRP